MQPSEPKCSAIVFTDVFFPPKRESVRNDCTVGPHIHLDQYFIWPIAEVVFFFFFFF